MKTSFSLTAALLVCLLFSNRIDAQDKIKLINSHDLIVDGIALYEDGKYEEALKKFDQIDRNDSLYISALSEKSLTLLRLEEFREAASVARTALGATSRPIPELYINLGTALDDGGDSIAALAVYEEGIKRFPKNHIMIFNKAVTLYKLKEYDKTIAALKEVLEIQPKHAGTHLLLGSIATIEGKYVQAMLCLNTFLMIEPASERSKNAITLLQSVATEKPSSEEARGIKLSDGDDFSDIELLLTNKIALNKKYKVDCDFQFDFIKQNHLMMEKLEYNAGDKGFWMKFYVPFYKKLMEAGQFENFSYYILLGVEDDDVQAVLKKNLTDIKEFGAWWPDAWYEEHKMHSYALNGKKTEAQFWYSENGKLQLIGNMKAVGKTTTLYGDYEAYSDNGCMSAKGSFNDKGLRTGECLFYDENGYLSEKAIYADDKFNGKYTAYYTNGNIRRESNYANGLLEGESKLYYLFGGLSESKVFKADKLNGAYVSYYRNGQKDYEATYKDDKLTGTLIKYYPDGTKQKETAYKDDKPSGASTEYYRNGQLSLNQTYADGYVEGAYKTYHSNGQVSAEGSSRKGTNVGEYKSYYPDGKVKEVFNYDETGKLNGTKKVYDRDGSLYYEWDFTKGEISGYRYYNKQGGLISEGKRKLTKFPFTGYFEDGTKRFEGDYDGSEQNGLWKYYDRYGNLASEEPYVKGKTEGLLKTYHPNGKLEYQVKYINDARDGYYEEYFPNGKMAEQGWYKEGNKIGNWKRYHMNGNLRWHIYFLDDQQHGWQSYYDEKGKLETEYYMEYGRTLKIVNFDTSEMAIDTVDFQKESFTLTDHHYNGAVYFAGEYKNGDANGSYKWYGAGGQLITEGNYMDDERDGNWKWYNVEGKLTSEGSYDYGAANGIWKDYYDNGKPSYVRQFLMDSQEGEMTRYHKNGQVDMQGPYESDERNGAFNYYDELGQLQIIKYYAYGKLIGYSYNGTDGKPVKMITVTDGDATVTSYFQNGKKAVEYTLSNGEYNGKYTEYFSNGKVYEEVTYKDDEWNGERKVYYSSGKLRLEESYRDGIQEAAAKEYLEDGKLKETDVYYGGDRYGERVIYANGKPSRTIMYYNDKIVYEK